MFSKDISPKTRINFMDQHFFPIQMNGKKFQAKVVHRLDLKSRCWRCTCFRFCLAGFFQLFWSIWCAHKSNEFLLFSAAHGKSWQCLSAALCCFNLQLKGCFLFHLQIMFGIGKFFYHLAIKSFWSYTGYNCTSSLLTFI